MNFNIPNARSIGGVGRLPDRRRCLHGALRALACVLALVPGACADRPRDGDVEGGRSALAADVVASTGREESAPPPAAVDPGLPEVATPFPSGLSGQIVFQSDRRGPENPHARTKIFLLDLAPRRVRMLTKGASWRDANPRWSPDGSRIAFASNRAHYERPPEPGQPDYDIYVMNADGGAVERLTTDPANDEHPIWAPDGKSIFFASDRQTRGDLFRVWVADRRTDQITSGIVGRSIMPAPSPDGRHVAFAAQTLWQRRFWAFQVHLVDLAEGRRRALTSAGGACWPAWSPDGREIAYVMLDREPSGLAVMNIESGQTRPLVSDERMWSYYPDWSADGRMIVFSVSPEHHEGEDWDLALMRTDRPGAFERLTSGAGNDRHPDWRP